MLFVVRCALCNLRCLRFVVRALLVLVCLLLFWCLWFVVFRVSAFVVVCCLLFVVRWLLVVRCSLFVVRCLVCMVVR